jgi:hypothetical protein
LPAAFNFNITLKADEPLAHAFGVVRVSSPGGRLRRGYASANSTPDVLQLQQIESIDQGGVPASLNEERIFSQSRRTVKREPGQRRPDRKRSGLFAISSWRGWQCHL